MRQRIALITLTIAVIATSSVTADANDWGTVGKVLTGVTGLRLITGGNVDIIGNLTGINSDRAHTYGRRNTRYYTHSRRCHYMSQPIVVYEKEWVPGYTIHDRYRGTTFIEGYYITRKAYREEMVYSCSPQQISHRRYYR